MTEYTRHCAVVEACRKAERDYEANMRLYRILAESVHSGLVYCFDDIQKADPRFSQADNLFYKKVGESGEAEYIRLVAGKHSSEIVIIDKGGNISIALNDPNTKIIEVPFDEKLKYELLALAIFGNYK